MSRLIDGMFSVFPGFRYNQGTLMKLARGVFNGVFLGALAAVDAQIGVGAEEMRPGSVGFIHDHFPFC